MGCQDLLIGNEKYETPIYVRILLSHDAFLFKQK